MRFGPAAFGFTLIELIVTVAVIAILSGIALPMFANYFQGARTKSCVHEATNVLRQVAVSSVGGTAADNPAPPLSSCASGGTLAYSQNTAYAGNDFFTFLDLNVPARTVICYLNTGRCIASN